MKLTTTLGLFLLLVPVAFLAIFAGSSPSAFRTLPALGLGVLLVLILQFVLLTRDSRSAPFDILIVGIVFVFFLARLAVLWLMPSQFIYPGIEFEPGEVVRTLAFLCFGTVAAVVGFRAGVGWRLWRRSPTRHDAAPLLRLSMGRLLVIGLVYVGIEVMLWVRLGTASAALTPDAAGGGLLFLKHFISLYAALGIGLAAGLDRWPRMGGVARAKFCAFVAMFMLYTIAAGSRSGLFTILVILAIYLLIRQGNFRLNPRLLALGAGALVVSVLLFPAATMVRFAWSSAFETPDGRFALDFTRQGSSESWLSSGVLSALNRLNGLDPLLMIVGRKEAAPLSDFVSGTQVVQSAVNSLVPSAVLGHEPFPGVLPTSRLFSAVYRGRSAEYIQAWYQTDMWTFWGGAFALGGWLRGGVMMFAIALFLGAGYRVIVRKTGRLSLLWRLWWLYTTYLVIISYGFDADFTAAIYILVGGIVVTMLVRPRVAAPAERSSLPPFPQPPHKPLGAAPRL